MTEFTASTGLLVDDDHTSEPRLLRCASGILLMFYRVDPGLEGSHVGDDGHIVVRRSADNGTTWSDAIQVYSDSHDDRNHGVFQVSSGRVFCLFRRISATASRAIDRRYVYSEDDGLTWIDLPGPFSAFPSPAESLYVPTRGILLPTYGKRLHFTENGTKFDNSSELVSPETISSLGLNENAQAYLGSGVLYSVWRHEDYSSPGFYGAYSEDYGETWSTPAKMNVLDHWGSAPTLHVADGKLYLLAGDRHSPAEQNRDSCLWLCSLPIADYENLRGWTVETSLPRPEPSGYPFYGYPSAVHVEDGSWLVAFTESYSRDSGEGADLYLSTADLGFPQLVSE